MTRIYFVHIRNIRREHDGSFYETDHLDGDNDIVGIVNALLREEEQRWGLPPGCCRIPMRPGHGYTSSDIYIFHSPIHPTNVGGDDDIGVHNGYFKIRKCDQTIW